MDKRKIYWILNKYCLDSIKLESGYLSFLEKIQKTANDSNIELVFLRFTPLKLDNTLDIIYPEYECLDLENISSIESKYKFTFRQALYADLVQISKRLDLEVSENEFERELNDAIKKFKWLESFIANNGFEAIFIDQSPEYEMFFATAICNFNKLKIFKSLEGVFFGRTLFKSANLAFSKSYDIQRIEKLNYKESADVISSILNYRVSKKAPYDRSFSSPKRKVSFLNRLRAFARQFRENLDIHSKRKFYSDLPKNYIFFGPHLPRESTVHFNAMPYSDQSSIIKAVARVLPLDTYLVVREHPYWHRNFSRQTVKFWKGIPNVRVVSPKLSIHDIIENSKMILTINSTTGIEGVYYRKKILTFAPTYYSNLKGVYYLNGLYDIPKHISNDYKPEKNDLESFTESMVNNSVNFSLNSYSFQDKNEIIPRVEKMIHVLKSFVE